RGHGRRDRRRKIIKSDLPPAGHHDRGPVLVGLESLRELDIDIVEEVDIQRGTRRGCRYCKGKRISAIEKKIHGNRVGPGQILLLTLTRDGCGKRVPVNTKRHSVIYVRETVKGDRQYRVAGICRVKIRKRKGRRGG